MELNNFVGFNGIKIMLCGYNNIICYRNMYISNIGK